MTDRDAEAELAVLLDTISGPRLKLHRHPVLASRALTLLQQVPELWCQLSDSVEGRMVRAELQRASGGRSTALHQATTVLELPTEPGTYNLGHERATQRRKARKARAAGVTWRPVTDPAERQTLLQRADDYERNNPRSAYRKENPENADLMAIGLWLAAFHEGEPILLSVTAVDGEWAILRYFRSLAETDAASNARYLMTEVLAEELGRAGVRYLCDPVSPFRLTPGLRHFARMVGFRVRRVRFR